MGNIKKMFKALIVGLVGFGLFVAFGRILFLLNAPSDAIFFIGIALMALWFLTVVVVFEFAKKLLARRKNEA